MLQTSFFFFSDEECQYVCFILSTKAVLDIADGETLVREDLKSRPRVMKKGS